MTKDDSTAIVTTDQSKTLEAVKQIVLALPDVDDDPTERMMAYVVQHDPEEWESLWESLPNVRDNPGRRFRVEAIRGRPSDFEGPLGVYLICEVTWLDTGESGLLSCSSQMGMVQLLKLWRDGRLPADLEIVRKEKPTKRGFHPVHFRYLDPAQVAKPVNG